MAPRKKPNATVTPLRPPSRKGIPASTKQKDALAQGRAVKKKQLSAGPKTERTRWQMLIDGEITVADLGDDELKRMQTRDRYDGFNGRPPDWTKHRKLFQSMKQESIKRAQGMIDASITDAVEFLAGVVRSRDAQVKDRIKASEILMARGMGSVPTHIVNHEGTKWDDMLNDDDEPVVVYLDQEGTA
jgi:hypothetical protein